MAEFDIGGYDPGTNVDVAGIAASGIGIMSDGTVQAYNGALSGAYGNVWGNAPTTGGVYPVAPYTPAQLQMMQNIVSLQQMKNALSTARDPNYGTISALQITINQQVQALKDAMKGGGGGSIDIDAVDNVADGEGYNAQDVPGAMYASIIANMAPTFSYNYAYGSRGLLTLVSLAQGMKLLPVTPYADPNAPALPADVNGVAGVFAYAVGGTNKSASYDPNTFASTVTGDGKINRLTPITMFGSGFSKIISPNTKPIAVSMTSMVKYAGGVKWKADGLYASNGQRIAFGPGSVPMGDGTGATLKFGPDGVMVFGTRFEPVYVQSSIAMGFLATAINDAQGGLMPGMDLRESVWTYLVAVNVQMAGTPVVTFWFPCLPSNLGAGAVPNAALYYSAGGGGGQAEGPGW